MFFVQAATVFLTLFRFCDCLLNESFDLANIVFANSIESVIDDVCRTEANCNSGVDIFIARKDDATNDLVTRIITNSKVVYQVESEVEVKDLLGRRRFFVLLFLQNSEDFDKFYNQLTFKNFFPNGIYVIVFESAKPHEMESIFKRLWRKFIYNVNIITQTPSGTVEMFTFIPFGNSGKCGDESSVKINEFDKESKRWKSDVLFPKKFKDLNQCTIRCGLFKLEPVNIIDSFPNGSVHVRGFDVDVFTQLMHSINARVNFTVYPIDTGKIFPNGTVTGLLGRMVKREVDASLRSWSLQLDRRKVLSETVSYFSDKLVLIMPLPLPLNPLLKFVKPLSPEVWFALFGLFLAASVVIFLLKLMPRNLYGRIIGKRLRNEFLNILIAAVGLSQPTLPEKNFPRYLLMMFLIFCLVVRSLYLGSLFNMLKSDIRSKEYTSISDFYNAGFDFYMYDSLSQRLDYPLINERRKIIDLSLVDDYCRKTLNPEFKGVVFQYVTSALYSNQQNYKSFTYKICRESLMTNHLVFYFTQGFYLVDEMNEMIGAFKTGGITQFYISKYADEKFRKVDDQGNGPSELLVEHFSGIFQVWGFGLALGFAIFIVEILLNIRRVKSNRIKFAH